MHHHEHSTALPFLESHAFGDFAIGVAQGLAFTLTGQPFDSVRLNSQAGNISVVRQSSRAVAAHLYRTEGVKGFFQGWTFPAVGFTLGRGVQSASMNALRDYFIAGQRAEFAQLELERKERLRRQQEERDRRRPWYESSVRALGSSTLMQWSGVAPADEERAAAAAALASDDFGSRMQNDMNLAIWKNVLCAAVGAVAYTTIHTPFDMVRVRMVTQGQYPHRLYHNSLDCAWKLYECGGVSKLYLGYRAALIRDIPAQIIVFGLYGVLRPLLPQDETHSVQARYGVLLGGVVGMVQWSLVIPLDCVKTRLQTATEDMHSKPGWLAMARRIHALHGVRGFYVGLPAAVIKAFVSNAALFASMEIAAKQVAVFQRKHALERQRGGASSQSWQ